jgi:hypothetical protein
VLAANPTLPLFDGAEDRNGARNADEIGFSGPTTSPAPTRHGSSTTTGTVGGLADGAEFVIVGALNSDPFDGDGAGAVNQVLALDRVYDPLPASDGSVEASAAQGLPNSSQQGDPAFDTADFLDHPRPGIVPTS